MVVPAGKTEQTLTFFRPVGCLQLWHKEARSVAVKLLSPPCRGNAVIIAWVDVVQARLIILQITISTLSSILSEFYLCLAVLRILTLWLQSGNVRPQLLANALNELNAAADEVCKIIM